jgi:hypothetical protein
MDQVTAYDRPSLSPELVSGTMPFSSRNMSQSDGQFYKTGTNMSPVSTKREVGHHSDRELVMQLHQHLNRAG